MATNTNGGIYAPLKQLISDSESDEDSAKLTQEKFDTFKTMDINSGLESPKMNQYSISDGEEGNTNQNTVETTLDNVSFIQSEDSHKMSTKRRIVFISWILFTIVSVIVFLFVIPCSSTDTCSSKEWQDKTTSWELPYEEIELTGMIQVVNAVQPNSKNLLLIYRGNHMRIKSKNSTILNGILLIVGNSGKIGWYTREERIPTDINCNLLDANHDGQTDCLLSGTGGLVAALNPLSGYYYWNNLHQHNKAFVNISAIDFPILFKDMDNDNTVDLLATVALQPNPTQNVLVTISGATGCVIGDFIHITDCLSVHKLNLDKSYNISYLCKNETKEAVRTLSYDQYYNKLMKLEPVQQSPKVKLNQVKHSVQQLKRKISNSREVFKSGKGKLIVENSGECPDSCRTNLRLILERNGTANLSWEYSANYIFTMRPSVFAFANSIKGFVFKLYQWNIAHNAKGPKILDESHYNKQNLSPKDFFSNKSHMNISMIAGSLKYENFTAHDISERIVLICFDKQHTHIVNVSQTDILQICVRDTIHGAQPVCQPDLNYQEKSLTITDLDGDHSHELVSYHSTFLNPKDCSKQNIGTLTSVVKVIRLENELPKLFNSNY